MSNFDAADPVVMLARYDTQGAQDAALLKIFGCGYDDLAAVRDTQEYKDARAAFEGEKIESALTRNAAWNRVEDEALAGLIESLPLATDPRVLITVARAANQAQRTQLQPAGVIDMNKREASRTTVIRLRTSFTAILSKPDGAKTLVQREETTTLEETVGEDRIPTSQAVESLMLRSLGVRVSNDMPRDVFGADQNLLQFDSDDFHDV